jgi:outer membrane protein OmpA-like peptidoglycan-associated protein
MRAAIALAAIGLGAAGLGAQSKYADPDAPNVQAAARAALPRAKILNIVGVTRGVDATLKDLGAKVVGREIRIALSADVLFDFDSYALRTAAADSLRKVADVLNEYSTSPALIEGHTDGKGTDQYNQTLSDRRADSVKRWLVEKGGVSSSRMTAKGWGKTKPIAPNAKPDGSDDPEGRQKNRRVEIVVQR